MFPNSISQAKASKFKGKPGNVQNSANKQQLNRLKKRHQYKSYSSLISLGTYLESRSGKKALSSHIFINNIITLTNTSRKTQKLQ